MNAPSRGRKRATNFLESAALVTRSLGALIGATVPKEVSICGDSSYRCSLRVPS
jgi:hypothetical protein